MGTSLAGAGVPFTDQLVTRRAEILEGAVPGDEEFTQPRATRLLPAWSALGLVAGMLIGTAACGGEAPRDYDVQS